MKILYIYLLLLSSVLVASTVDKKIKKTSSKLTSYHKNYSNISKKMDQTAKEIIRQKQQLIKQTKILQELKDELSLKKFSYKENISQLKLFKKSQAILQTQQDKVQEKLMHVISQSVSLSIVVEKDSPKTQDALIEFEVLQVMLKNSRKKAKELSIKFIANKKNIEMLRTHATTLESSIASIDQKQKKLIKITSEYKKAIKKLELAKTSYKKELKDIINKQNALKKTLAQLNLIKIDETKRAKEQKEREEAFKNKNIVANENLPKVKKHGSSYQAVKTIKYHGAKTIAPLTSYVITKKYGTYIDPIYGIKIFNESISLRPKTSDTKVKTVFNGKVIYAQKTAVLKNVVVVEHKNGLHTIYANLSKIAPNIKKGKKVKKGSVIGRIKDELTFEVTYKNYHINPIRLFN